MGHEGPTRSTIYLLHSRQRQTEDTYQLWHCIWNVEQTGNPIPTTCQRQRPSDVKWLPPVPVSTRQQRDGTYIKYSEPCISVEWRWIPSASRSADVQDYNIITEWIQHFSHSLEQRHNSRKNHDNSYCQTSNRREFLKNAKLKCGQSSKLSEWSTIQPAKTTTIQ